MLSLISFINRKIASLLWLLKFIFLLIFFFGGGVEWAEEGKGRVILDELKRTQKVFAESRNRNNDHV